MEDFMLPCLNKKLFGIDCPGCGAQRALALFFEGEFMAAFKMYPAIFTLLILLGFLIINLFIKFKFDWHIKVVLIVLNGIIIISAYLYKLSFLIN